MIYPVPVLDQKFEDHIGLLLIADEHKSHYTYIKDFNRFVCNKAKCKTKKCRYCLQFFSSERVLIEHKETCLIINVKQTVKLKSCSIKFKNYFRLLAVSFKIYAHFECNIKS